MHATRHPIWLVEPVQCNALLCQQLREIDGATLLAALTADPDDGEAEVVENITRDSVFAKQEEMQKTVARLNLN